MDVACSTYCFTKEPFERALRRIAEMEFSRVDLGIGDANIHIRPDDVVENPSAVLARIRQGPTLSFTAITLRTDPNHADFAKRLDAVAHFGKQLSTPILVLEAAPAGSSFDAEAERLKALIKLISVHGSILTVVTKTGTLAELPETALKLCESVPGLGLTLDPSHLLCGPNQGKSYDELFPYIKHVHLRDSGKTMDQFQVKVGRGEIEYGRVVVSLGRYKIPGSLVVQIEDNLPNLDMEVEAEVRKLGLLLESLI